MSERDELKAILDARGVDYDGRLGLDKLRELEEATADFDDLDDDEPGPFGDDSEPPAPEPASEPSTLRRVAPNVWVDDKGRRQVGHR